jgi:hypothetical protein
MIFSVTFFFMMMLPGMNEPIVHAEEVPTLEECVGMVADAMLRARKAQQTGSYQAGCTIKLPEMENH